jgi:hypothetical protein
MSREKLTVTHIAGCLLIHCCIALLLHLQVPPSLMGSQHIFSQVVKPKEKLVAYPSYSTRTYGSPPPYSLQRALRCLKEIFRDVTLQKDAIAYGHPPPPLILFETSNLKINKNQPKANNPDRRGEDEKYTKAGGKGKIFKHANQYHSLREKKEREKKKKKNKGGETHHPVVLGPVLTLPLVTEVAPPRVHLLLQSV